MIVKETLGEKAYNQMQKVMDEKPEPKEYVIYCNDQFLEKYLEALNEATVKSKL